MSQSNCDALTTWLWTKCFVNGRRREGCQNTHYAPKEEGTPAQLLIRRKGINNRKENNLVLFASSPPCKVVCSEEKDYYLRMMADLNCQPFACKANALPIELIILYFGGFATLRRSLVPLRKRKLLTSHRRQIFSSSMCHPLAERMELVGLEPRTSAVQMQRSTN